jgi:hypothetical protein
MYPQSMHTIGCPATSFFLPKLKNASVLTTDPLPPAVRSGVRDLEAVNTFFLTKKFGCAMNVLEVDIFINSLFVMMCFE